MVEKSSINTNHSKEKEGIMDQDRTVRELAIKLYEAFVDFIEMYRSTERFAVTNKREEVYTDMRTAVHKARPYFDKNVIAVLADMVDEIYLDRRYNVAEDGTRLDYSTMENVDYFYEELEKILVPYFGMGEDPSSEN